MPQLEFFGETLKDCLNQIRDRLGSEAVIVETRKVRRGGCLGIGGQDVFCVVAEREDPPAVHLAPAPPQIPMDDGDPDVRAVQEALDRIRQRAIQEAQATPSPLLRKPLVQTLPPSTAVINSRQASQEQPIQRPSTRLDALPNPNAKNLIRRATFPKVTPEEARAAMAPEPPKPTTPASLLSRLKPTPAQVAPPPQTVQRQALPLIRNLKPLLRPQTLEPTKAEAVVTATEAPLAENISQLRANLQHLRQKFSDYERNLSAVSTHGSSGFGSKNEFAWLQDKMEYQGIAPAIMLDLMHQLRELHEITGDTTSPEQLTGLLVELMAHRIACAGPIQLAPHRLKTVALIGPTGVGKTTTIAKLAAHYALMERKKVALLTIDTYRIAAVEQLKTYSQIIDLPLCVAHSVNDIAPALSQFANYDLLLVDTAGRSQHNTPQIEELKPYIEALRCETHLVLASPTKESDLLETARRFSTMRLDRILFSKLDETSTYGTILNVSDRVGIPLSYITTGQKVPEDISIAEPSSLAGLILN